MNSSKLLRIASALLGLAVLGARLDAASCCHREMSATTASANSLYQLKLNFQDEHGRAVAFSDLKGHPVVIAMFFASCSTVCPALVGELQAMQKTLPAEVRADTRFVLVSFDSDRDTPAMLADYRSLHHLDDRWTLLRGDAHSVRQLAALLGVSYRREADGSFSHSTIATVLNAAGEVVATRNGLGGSLQRLSDALAIATRGDDAGHPAS